MIFRSYFRTVPSWNQKTEHTHTYAIHHSKLTWFRILLEHPIYNLMLLQSREHQSLQTVARSGLQSQRACLSSEGQHYLFLDTSFPQQTLLGTVVSFCLHPHFPSKFSLNSTLSRTFPIISNNKNLSTSD